MRRLPLFIVVMLATLPCTAQDTMPFEIFTEDIEVEFLYTTTQYLSALVVLHVGNGDFITVSERYHEYSSLIRVSRDGTKELLRVSYDQLSRHIRSIFPDTEKSLILVLFENETPEAKSANFTVYRITVPFKLAYPVQPAPIQVNHAGPLFTPVDAYDPTWGTPKLIRVGKGFEIIDAYEFPRSAIINGNEVSPQPGSGTILLSPSRWIKDLWPFGHEIMLFDLHSEPRAVAAPLQAGTILRLSGFSDGVLLVLVDTEKGKGPNLTLIRIAGDWWGDGGNGKTSVKGWGEYEENP